MIPALIQLIFLPFIGFSYLQQAVVTESVKKPKHHQPFRSLLENRIVLVPINEIKRALELIRQIELMEF